MNINPRILAIIPARGGSKSVSNKNMKLIGDKPLIAYTIESALQAKMLTKIIVSSDNLDTLNFARQFTGIEIPFTRPRQLATDASPTIDVVKHALLHYLAHGISFDFVVLLQPTSPFRSCDLIDNAIKHIIHSHADCLISVQKIPDRFNPYWSFECQDKTLKMVGPGEKLISRRQNLPDTFHRDGKIYITRTSLIMQGKLIGGTIAGFIADNEPDINIDTPEDWKNAHIAMEKWKTILKNQF
ncbi:acylneuraminate cytidylyltransferase family protein [Dyadobacter arcticus]|uniref:CMP-N-acetylneuraminic acid synthetase n=1 Tax=Dyadobacter arcticus TaxID=1078754 RepID=A0ABX0UQT6_9BACT|nr:acylneuraminate cytidylyltransferase family protein [Dyadobacter arcticus]NIJ55336.1 CMP-N-acetylneuraminic acid synthetase [Dyadobacter arcticus]